MWRIDYTLHPFKGIASNIDTYLLALVASADSYVKCFIRAVYGAACFLDVDSTDFAELLDGLAATVVNFLTFVVFTLLSGFECTCGGFSQVLTFS